MKTLMICTLFPLETGNEYLTNELARALSDRGHEIQVVVIDWNAPTGGKTVETTINGVRVLAFAPKGVDGFGWFAAKASKWILSPLFAALEMRKRLSRQHFDYMISFSPLSSVSALVLAARWLFASRSYLVQWDFFPFHQRAIDLVPNPIAFHLVRLMEQSLIRKMDTIGCMSPKNIEYFKRHYRLRPEQRVELLRIWGDTTPVLYQSRETIRARYEIPFENPVAIFGGQMTQGRGINELLAAAAIAKDENSNIRFLLIGDGRLSGMVESHIAKGGDNVIYRKRIPRGDYLALASACDVGIIATVRGVGVPTFPSKIIDYLRAGIPVVASIEESTDYGEFIEQWNLGIAVKAGSPRYMLDSIKKIFSSPEMVREMTGAGKVCLDEVFSVDKTADTIENAMHRAINDTPR